MIIRKKATVEQIEGKKITLLLEGGQTLQLSKDELDSPGEIGATYVVTILPEKEAVLDQESLARTLLNQILKEESVS